MILFLVALSILFSFFSLLMLLPIFFLSLLLGFNVNYFHLLALSLVALSSPPQLSNRSKRGILRVDDNIIKKLFSFMLLLFLLFFVSFRIDLIWIGLPLSMRHLFGYLYNGDLLNIILQERELVCLLTLHESLQSQLLSKLLFPPSLLFPLLLLLLLLGLPGLLHLLLYLLPYLLLDLLHADSPLLHQVWKLSWLLSLPRKLIYLAGNLWHPAIELVGKSLLHVRLLLLNGLGYLASYLCQNHQIFILVSLQIAHLLQQVVRFAYDLRLYFEALDVVLDENSTRVALPALLYYRNHVL